MPVYSAGYRLTLFLAYARFARFHLFAMLVFSVHLGREFAFGRVGIGSLSMSVMGCCLGYRHPTPLLSPHSQTPNQIRSATNLLSCVRSSIGDARAGDTLIG